MDRREWKVCLDASLLCVQAKPGGGFCDSGWFRHLQQGVAFLQREVDPRPAPDAGGVRRVGHVCAAARRLPGECERKQTSHREVSDLEANKHTLT